jgi:hypothetical protein
MIYVMNMYRKHTVGISGFVKILNGIRRGKNECWEWDHSRTVAGYGRIRIDGKYAFAHRYSWLYHKGEIPKDMMVCHSCDNPPCINPNHLFIGSNTDNMRDCVKKGRYVGPPRMRGVKHPKSKLNDSSVAKIREMYGNKTIVEIAKIFNIAPSLAHRVARREVWRHVK